MVVPLLEPLLLHTYKNKVLFNIFFLFIAKAFAQPAL